MDINSQLWKRQGQKYLKRKAGNRGRPKDVILIVCEGERTEPDYFSRFRLPSVEVIIIGAGCNTDSLVKEALRHKVTAKKFGTPVNQVWCVMDRDEFPAFNFNNAFHLAAKHKIRIAYSNEAFELWYLLHFEYLTAPLSRKDYMKRLDNFLHKKYEKNDKTMYDKLFDKQEVAIKHAEKLLSSYPSFKLIDNKPSTTVHNLVKELRKLKIF